MKHQSIKKYILWLVPILFLLGSFKEIYIAVQYARLSQLDLQQSISLWASEINSTGTYTSSQLGVILHIDRAIFTTIIFALFTYFNLSSPINSNG